MADFSTKSVSPFENLRFKQIGDLLTIIHDSKLHSREHLKKLYGHGGRNFEVTVHFLVLLGLVTLVGDSFELTSKEFGVLSPLELRRKVLAWLVQVPSSHQTDAFEFLRKFNSCDGQMRYCSHPATRSKESAVRNFLMEIDVIQKDREDYCYLLDPIHASLYALSKKSHSVISPDQLKRNLVAKELLGAEAEVIILKWEKERLGEPMAGAVQHVALANVAAGYDILSFSLRDGEFTPRYIEVKAVSRQSFGFYWSANEIQVASVLSQSYYLYLLPVITDKTFSLADLKIIQNPVETVLGQGSNWEVEGGLMHCVLGKTDAND